VAEHLGGPRGAQQIAVLDRVRAERHRRDEAHHLGARVGATRSLAERDRLLDQRLDPEPPGERPGQQRPGVGDGALVVEGDVDAIELDAA